MIRRALTFMVKMAVGTLAILAAAVLIGLVVSWFSTPRAAHQTASPAVHRSGAVEKSAGFVDMADARLGAPKDPTPDATFGTIGLVVGGRELGDGPTRQRTPLGAPFMALGQEAGDTKADGSDFPTAPSAASLDVGSFALATPLVGFGGLHPIAESWYRGVASGIASHMGYGFPDWYLALPIGPGFRVRIVGAGGSVERVSTDAGPALHMQRPPYNRVADLSVRDWLTVCGVPLSLGLCPVSVSILGRVR